MGKKQIPEDRAMATIPTADVKTMPNEAFQDYSNWYVEGSMDDLRFRFTSRLREAMRLLRVTLEEQLRAEGMTRALWEALFVVVLTGGNSTQKSLAHRLRIEGATLVRLLDRLEEGGLVERVQGVDDRRSKYIKPTKAGLEMAQRLIERSNAARARFLDGWSRDDLEEGLTILSRLVPPPREG